MATFNKLMHWGLAGLATSMLCACGGGGGDGTPAPPPVLTPAPVPAPIPAPPLPSSCTATCRGADPTPASVEADAGPYAVATLTITQTNGAAATVYYPTGSGETFGAIVTMPGWDGDQSNLDWLGPRLASNGFVVINVDTPSRRGDFPDARARFGVQALNQVVALSANAGSVLFGKVDAARLGMIGHSMGGGATLVAARDNPGFFKAILPLSPWYDQATRDFPSGTPTLVFVCSGDTTATVAGYAMPIYDNLRSSAKAYVEAAHMPGGDAHNCVHTRVANRPKLGKIVVSWMKRWLDADPRYAAFVCGAQNPGTDTGFTNVWRSTCPF
jgi:dienelactone hydrolase